VLRAKDPKVVIPPLHGALLKNEQDVHLFERVAFLARRGQSVPKRSAGQAGGIPGHSTPCSAGRTNRSAALSTVADGTQRFSSAPALIAAIDT